MINEALAKKYFPGVNPVGRAVTGGFGVTQRIIGVVENVAEGGLTDEARPARYYLGGTVTWFSTDASFIVKTKRPGDAERMLDAARATVNRVAPNFAVQGTTTMSRVVDTAVGPARQVMQLLAILSGLALILGAIGIYGVISHFAARRQRGWAIRVALGASSQRVVGQVVGQGVGLVLIGVVIGAVGTAAMARLMSTLLFGVGTIDAMAFGAASAALIAIGACAAFIPARRAGTVDPILALREQ